MLKRALGAVRDQGGRPGLDVRWPWTARRVAPELFDDDAWHALGTRNVQIARDVGALAVLPLALNYLATMRVFEGNLEDAAALLGEADAIAAATGTAPIVFGRLQLAGFRGDEAQTSALIEASEPASIARGELGHLDELPAPQRDALATVFGSCWPPARPYANARSMPSISSRSRKRSSPGSPGTACRIRRSAPSFSSVPARSNGTCARCSPSSGSAPGASYGWLWAITAGR